MKILRQGNLKDVLRGTCVECGTKVEVKYDETVMTRFRARAPYLSQTVDAISFDTSILRILKKFYAYKVYVFLDTLSTLPLAKLT